MQKIVPTFIGMALISAAAPKKAKVWVLGDSTASVYGASEYPRKGWAQVLQERFNPDSVEIQDKALSGRSSKSFYTDRAGWPAFKDQITAGDYVVIEFSHNDEKTEASLSTLPGSTFEQYLSIYIDFARKVGAIPILATPIQRLAWNSDNKTLKQTHVIPGRGDYPQAIRDLAASKNVALIDMTKLTNDYIESVGKDSATKLYLNLSRGEYPNYPNGNRDSAHLHERGARTFAGLFTSSLVSQKIAPIANWVRGAIPVSIARDAATSSHPDEIVYKGNGVMQIICNERATVFSILDINGGFENDLGSPDEGNTLSLTSKNGKPLPPGKYILRYRVSGGASRSALIENR